MRITKPTFVALTCSLTMLCSVLLPTPTARAAAGNLIANPSVENSTGGKPNKWTSDKWGTNNASLTYPNNGHTGSRSLKVTISQYTDGDGKWFFNPVTAVPAHTYSYSEYYKSSVRTELLVRFTDANGGDTYRWLQGANASGGWKQLKVTFQAPADAKQLTVLHILDGVGSLQTDDFKLTDVTPAAGQNIIPNNSLETADGSQPQAWHTEHGGSNTASFSYPTNGHTGSRSVRVDMSQHTSGDAYWSYGLQPVTGSKTYEFSDYYQADIDTEIYAHILLQDGSEQWDWVGMAPHSQGWNQFYSQFTMPAGAVSAEVYHSLIGKGFLATDDYKLNEYKPVGLNRPLVSLTFDDALRSIYDNGLPVLQKYNFLSTQYLLTGYTNDPNYMTVDMMRAFRDAGHEIGSHTVTHPTLPDLTTSQVTTELTQSKADLTSWLGVTPTSFASPHGEYNAETMPLIKQYYSSHRSVDVGFNSKDNFDRYNIKVQNIVSSTTPEQITAWVNQAKSEHTWLVLVYHDVLPTSDNIWNTPPAALDQQLGIIQASGVPVVTVSQALSEITPQL